jgi:mono/diheme cytochrome c family protein
MISSQVATSQQPTSLREADQTFQARCSTCHAEHGEGSEVGASLNVPDLRSQRIQGQDDDTLRRIIKEGKGDMPTFKRDFTDDEVNQLIRLVRSFARQNDNAKAHQSSNERGSKGN